LKSIQLINILVYISAQKLGGVVKDVEHNIQPPTTSLQCSHFQGRAKLATRFDPDNAFAHCAGCHRYFGANPYEFVAWVEEPDDD
jgi:hypothetical protein